MFGRPEYPESSIPEHYLSLFKPDSLNFLTVHAEIVGMKHHDLFRSFLRLAQERGVRIVRLDEQVRELLRSPAAIPVCDLFPGTIDGRSGTHAVQRRSR